jgi:outer membrane protein assembly factor BamB
LTIYDEVKGNKEYNLDFSDFCYTNSDYFEQREVQWVSYRDNILYVSIWHNGYAEPDSCYIIAINIDTMEVLWKSDSLVSNANNFILFDDVIMCAYGFTAEPDYIYQLNINTGETIDKYLLKTKADYLILKDDELYVRCYDTDYVFKVNE